MRHRRHLLLTLSAPSRTYAAELLGVWGIVTVVVGSGIMAERLSSDVALQLLANTIATTGGLVLFISLFAPVSGAQFNPVVTVVQWAAGRMPGRNVAPFIVAQVAGACLGAVTANAMFGLDAVNVSSRVRDGGPIIAGEVVATAVLLLLIEGFLRSDRAGLIPWMVAAWITAAYWCTSSTSFANPAVSIGRSLSDTFAGIDPTSLPMFFVGQFVGGAVGCVVARLVFD
ncbi:MAG: aquaporin family protein [Ilumatobacteraceae bacterium]|nr:aquaporin family protein [Ilumatobacteraceae bacterium]